MYENPESPEVRWIGKIVRIVCNVGDIMAD
jgi:hypothetical protein